MSPDYLATYLHTANFFTALQLGHIDPRKAGYTLEKLEDNIQSAVREEAKVINYRIESTLKKLE